MQTITAALLPDFLREDTPLSGLYKDAKDFGLAAGVCRVSSQMAGTLEFAKGRGFAVSEEMAGHPSMRKRMEKGFTAIVT